VTREKQQCGGVNEQTNSQRSFQRRYNLTPRAIFFFQKETKLYNLQYKNLRVTTTLRSAREISERDVHEGMKISKNCRTKIKKEKNKRTRNTVSKDLNASAPPISLPPPQYFVSMSATHASDLIRGKTQKMSFLLRYASKKKASSKGHERFAPLLETFGAIGLLFLVRPAGFLQPIAEELVVLLEQQVLTEYHVGFVKSLIFQLLSQNLSDAG